MLLHLFTSSTTCAKVKISFRSQREAKILRANEKPTNGNLDIRQEEIAVELNRSAQNGKSESRSTTIPPGSKRKVLGQNEGNYRTARSLSAEVHPTARASLEITEKRISAESALGSLKTARREKEILITKEAEKGTPFKQPLHLVKKKTVCDGVPKTVRENTETPSSNGSVESLLFQSPGQTTNGTGRSVRTAREKNSLLSLEPQLRLMTVEVPDEKGLEGTARENAKYSDLSGCLRGLRSNAAAHETRAKLANDRGQLKTARESSKVSRMQESDMKLRLQSMDGKLMDEESLSMIGQGKDRIFRTYGTRNRMMLKSRLQTASMKTRDGKKLQRATQDNSGPRSVSSDPSATSASMRMMKGELANCSELLKTAREQNEPDKPTSAKLIQQAARGKMMSKWELLKTVRGRTRNFRSPSRSALVLNKLSGRSKSEREQTEDLLKTAREGRDKASKTSKKESISKPLQVASSPFSKCVSRVTPGLSGQQINNEVTLEKGAREYSTLTRDQRADHGKKEDLGKKEKPSLREENDDERSENLMHLDTARTLSFKTPPRYHRFTSDENLLASAHQTAKHSAHRNSRCTFYTSLFLNQGFLDADQHEHLSICAREPPFVQDSCADEIPLRGSQNPGGVPSDYLLRQPLLLVNDMITMYYCFRCYLLLLSYYYYCLPHISYAWCLSRNCIMLPVTRVNTEKCH